MCVTKWNLSQMSAFSEPPSSPFHELYTLQTNYVRLSKLHGTRNSQCKLDFFTANKQARAHSHTDTLNIFSIFISVFRGTRWAYTGYALTNSEIILRSSLDFTSTWTHWAEAMEPHHQNQPAKKKFNSHSRTLSFHSFVSVFDYICGFFPQLIFSNISENEA